jgi:hypothetical protein
VQFVTANDLLRIYANPLPPAVNKRKLAEHFKEGITFLSVDAGDLSAADILLELLNLPTEYVDGPTSQGTTTYKEKIIPDFVFDAAVDDVKSFIRTNRRLPSEAFMGAQTLSLADFTATLAEHLMSAGPIQVQTGRLAFEPYFSRDAGASFRWPIHPEGFAPEELLALGRLQGWTLKPARLR